LVLLYCYVPMPPRYAMRSTSTPLITEEAEDALSMLIHCASKLSTSKHHQKQTLQPQKRLRVCVGHYLVTHPGSVCAQDSTAILKPQTRLTMSCQNLEESCLDDQSDTNKWPCVPADFSTPICLVISAGTPAMSSRHSSLLMS